MRESERICRQALKKKEKFAEQKKKQEKKQEKKQADERIESIPGGWRDKETGVETFYWTDEACTPKGIEVGKVDISYPEWVYVTAHVKATSEYLRKQKICPDCFGSNVESRGSETRMVKDIPYWGREVIWKITLPEFRCCDCGRESFLVDQPGFLRGGSTMLVRLEEFIVLLAQCTSSEGASKILKCMGANVSGDTVNRVLVHYDSDELLGDYAGRLKRELERRSCRRLRRMADWEAQEYANHLAYYMEPEILYPAREIRLDAMLELLELVFVKGKTSPDAMESPDTMGDKIVEGVALPGITELADGVRKKMVKKKNSSDTAVSPDTVNRKKKRNMKDIPVWKNE